MNPMVSRDARFKEILDGLFVTLFNKRGIKSPH